MYPTWHHNCHSLLRVQHSSQQWRTHRSHHRLLHQFRAFTHGCLHKYDGGHVEARQFHLRPYWENEVKHVINILKGSLSAVYNVPELIVKCCVQFITFPLVHIFHLSFPMGYFPDILKIAKIQPTVKMGDEQYMKNYRPIWILTFFPKYWRNVCLTGLIPQYKSIIFLMMHKTDSEEVDQRKPLLILLSKVH
jgi:hypothetical protein